MSTNTGIASLAAAALIALLAVVSPVRAQDETRDRGDREAQARFESGRLAFESGRYEEALADFQRAYELSPRPLILYNIGIVYDRLRRDADAVQAFEGYLAAVPDAENRADVEARVAILRRQLERSGETREELAPPPPARAPNLVALDAHEPVYEAWGWISSGTAVAASVVALVMWTVANDRYAALSQRCGELGCSRAEIDASEAPALVDGTNVALVTALVAAASAVAAWTLWAVDLPEGEHVALRIGPGSAQLSF